MELITTILGGLGVFLLGMKLLSDNLRSAAGDALRVLLERFTGGRLSSVATGTVFTAFVQSSSATTLATIGFVSAGLLTFTQAVGVIFGANLGTTATSWLVATLGLRVSISAFAYPMVGLGALATLLTRGRKAHIGGAVAGFGLIFVGIDILQVGMGDLAGQFDLSAVDAEGLWGQLILVGIGFLMTVVMQSSSAAIATTLTALFAGAVDLPQAAVLVVGQSVGTTVTAALAAIGASLAAKRTAVAHIIFNVVTAVLALLALPLFLMAHGAWVGAGRGLADATAVAIFHTGFKFLGVAVLLPVLGAFSAAVFRLVPGDDPQYAAGLDRSAAAIPAVAVDAAKHAQLELYRGLVEFLRIGWTDPAAVTRREEELEAMATGLARCREFLDQIQSDPEEEVHQRHLALLHTLDHLERLHRRVRGASKEFRVLAADDRLAEVRRLADEATERASAVGSETSTVDDLRSVAVRLAEERRRRRHALLQAAAGGAPAPTELDDLLRTLKWCDRIAFHLWRAGYYLEGGVFEPETDDFDSDMRLGDAEGEPSDLGE